MGKYSAYKNEHLIMLLEEYLDPNVDMDDDFKVKVTRSTSRTLEAQTLLDELKNDSNKLEEFKIPTKNTDTERMVTPIHKGTFAQHCDSGIPSCWVVMYWEDDLSDLQVSKDFNTLKEAKDFEDTMISYDDWLSSQETPLSTQ